MSYDDDEDDLIDYDDYNSDDRIKCIECKQYFYDNIISACSDCEEFVCVDCSELHNCEN